jgi:hypothetical protein
VPDGTIATVVLDDVDITELCIEGSTNHRLNRIDTASVRVNMQALAGVFGTQFPGAGSYLKVYYENDILGTSPVLYHHGRVLECETTANEDGGYTIFNSSNPLELWQHRPVRDDDGDFSKPLIVSTYRYGPEIVAAMVQNSETAGGGPPTDAEGPTRLALGGVASSGGTAPDLTGAPTDWPMTMAQLAALLVSTGALDIIVTPIEFDANDNYGLLDLYNGDFGNDLTTSVAFQYGMGAYNIRSLRWNENMSNMCNKLWYYLGPKCDDQHWQANVTGTDHGGTSPPGLAYPPGGDLSPPYSPTNNQIGVLRYQSQQEFDVRMDIQIFDALGDDVDCVSGNTHGFELYRRLWQMESWLRAQPLNLIHVTPTRDTEIGAFGIGDLVLVEATSEVKGGFSGGQRIYEYSIAWDAEESVPAIGELQVSSDAEGFDT